MAEEKGNYIKESRVFLCEQAKGTQPLEHLINNSKGEGRRQIEIGKTKRQGNRWKRKTSLLLQFAQNLSNLFSVNNEETEDGYKSIFTMHDHPAQEKECTDIKQLDQQRFAR